MVISDKPVLSWYKEASAARTYLNIPVIPHTALGTRNTVRRGGLSFIPRCVGSFSKKPLADIPGVVF